jgi:UDP-glucose 4-epimerase
LQAKVQPLDATDRSDGLKKTILLTGGAGFIGSHTAVELMLAGWEVLVLDNLCNSELETIERLKAVCGTSPQFVRGDVRDAALLDTVFASHPISAVMHFAGLKSVGESWQQAAHYLDNNVGGTACLVAAMERAGVRRLVFSSSATVYGQPDAVPIPESAPVRTTNPYGRSKLLCEGMLRELQAADSRWHVALLRYFNPVGAHASGLIGEKPAGVPNNLMPYITQVAAGKHPFLRVFGDDYATADGTGVRDYIHVVDLAKGHLAALRYLEQAGKGITVNLGTGSGVSVLQLVAAFTQATGIAIPHQILARRPGDVASCYAATDLALSALGWRAQLSVEAMCADAWRWECAQLSERPLHA